MDDDLRTALAAALGAEVVGAAEVHGGDVARAYRVELDDGRRCFAKTHPSPPPGFFTTEAADLRWLGEADAIAVPEVLAVAEVAPSFLALGWIEEGRPRPGTEADAGARLAALHRAGAPCFGREDRRTTSSHAVPNDPRGTWAECYRDDRILPLARIARDEHALPADAIAGLERLAETIHDLVPPDEPPSRLHGDLWSGNRLIDADGRCWLVDPAALGGHRELDLAMMRLFGGFGVECYEAYDDAFPLADGWEERVALHQVAPLVVHAIKFGGGYVGAARDAIAAYG